MAAEDGGGLTRKLGPIPMWGWALVLGGAVGVIAFLRRRNSSSSGSDTTDTSAQTGTDQVPTTIVPYNQGLSEAQWQQLMAAIRGLYGQPSGDDDTPPPDTQTGLPSPKVPSGSISVTPPSTTTATSPPKSTTTSSVHPLFITVPSGSGWSWSSIAAQYGHSWQDLWNYNLLPGVRPADTQAKLRSEGASHSLFGGTKVAIPSNWKKV